MKNLKIKKITAMPHGEDVWDISVKDNQNFFANGVLIHNCAEYVNPAYSACALASVNLSLCITNEKFDWQKFQNSVKIGTRYLNNTIDQNNYPLEKIKNMSMIIRPIGLGAMGFAHMLYKLKIPFNSPIAKQLARDIFFQLTTISMSESCRIAEETGQAYPGYDEETFFKANDRFFNLSGFGQENKKVLFMNELKERIKKFGIANSCFSSVAPNGSISFLANTTGGIEPVFALTYARKIEKLDKQYDVVYISDPIFEEYLSSNFDEKTKIKILKQVADSRGSCQKVEEIPEEMRKVFMVASDLSPMDHLESLAVISKSISLSCSKTINLSANATREEISEVYLRAHELGVIGVTVYRDGCREGILVHQTDDKDKDVIVRTNAPARPKTLPCHVYRMSILNRITNESEKWIVFIGLLNDEPYEIIAGKINGHDIPTHITEGEMIKTKKNGKKVYQFVKDDEILCDDVISTFMNELREYATRLMSWGLRHGAGIEYLRDVLQKSDGTVVDFNKAVLRAISKYVKQNKEKERCPTCNADLIYIEGCVKCVNPECSFSKCG